MAARIDHLALGLRIAAPEQEHQVFALAGEGLDHVIGEAFPTLALVRAGAHLCAFPEGTRSRDGSVGPFKGGVLQVAIGAGVPVLPVAISGSGAVLPTSGFRVRPGTIHVRIGTPIATTGLQVEDRNALARRARDAVIDLLHPPQATPTSR